MVVYRQGQALLARRDTREKLSMPMDTLAAGIPELLADIQKTLLERARQFRDEHTTTVDSYEEFKRVMEGRPGFVIAPWCGAGGCETEIKAETQATIRNVALDAADPAGRLCIKCGRPATAMAHFAKAY